LGFVLIESRNKDRRCDDDNAKNRKQPDQSATFSLGHSAPPSSLRLLNNKRGAKGVPKYLGQIPKSQFREKCGFLSEDFIKSKSFKEFRRQFYKARCEILRGVGHRKQASGITDNKISFMFRFYKSW